MPLKFILFLYSYCTVHFHFLLLELPAELTRSNNRLNFNYHLIHWSEYLCNVIHNIFWKNSFSSNICIYLFLWTGINGILIGFSPIPPYVHTAHTGQIQSPFLPHFSPPFPVLSNHYFNFRSTIFSFHMWKTMQCLYFCVWFILLKMIWFHPPCCKGIPSFYGWKMLH
jgi:hypothetical protein